MKTVLALLVFVVSISGCGAMGDASATSSALDGNWISVSPTRLPSCSALAWFDSEHGQYATGYLCHAPDGDLASVEAGYFWADNGVLQFSPAASTCPGVTTHFATYHTDAGSLEMGSTGYQKTIAVDGPVTLGCIDISAQVFTEGPLAPVGGDGPASSDATSATLALTGPR